MNGGPRPQCDATIFVLGLNRRCQRDAGHYDAHHYEGAYKQPTITWDEPRWQFMEFTGVGP